MAIGTTNSGKSTSSLAILDKLLIKKKKVLIIDPTGEYNNSFEDENVISLKLGVDTIIGIDKISEKLWCKLFEVEPGDTSSVTLSNAIESLRLQWKYGHDFVLKKDGEGKLIVDDEIDELEDDDLLFNISLLAEQILEESVSIDIKNNHVYKLNGNFHNRNQLLSEKINYFLSNSNIETLFKIDMSKKDLLSELDRFLKKDNLSLYIDTSFIGSNDRIGEMIIDIICSYALKNKRSQRVTRNFVIFIDEAHKYTKLLKNDYYSPGLISIAREGRKNGIFLFLTTQNPQDVPKELLGQIGTLLVHRLTHQNELNAIQNHLSDESILQVKRLNQGEAILSSINLLRDIQLKINVCSRKHSNSTPLY